ncbi:unnamed protein product, partial [Brassica oleracea]
MNYSEKILSSDQKPSRLTRDQEHVIMVSALRQVISNIRGDNTSSSNSVACEALHQPLDAGPCPMCSIRGCCGCAFPRREEIKKGEEAQSHRFTGLCQRPALLMMMRRLSLSKERHQEVAQRTERK